MFFYRGNILTMLMTGAVGLGIASAIYFGLPALAERSAGIEWDKKEHIRTETGASTQEYAQEQEKIKTIGMFANLAKQFT